MTGDKPGYYTVQNVRRALATQRFGGSSRSDIRSALMSMRADLAREERNLARMCEHARTEHTRFAKKVCKTHAESLARLAEVDHLLSFC